MSGWLAFVWLLVLGASLAWAVGVAAAFLWQRLATSDAVAPSVKRRRCLMIAALPWVLAGLVVFSFLLLGMAKPLGIVTDHCPYHGADHPHLCLAHLPTIAPGAVGTGITAILLLVFVVLAAQHLVRQRQVLHSLRSMLKLARRKGPLHILEEERALAFAAAVPTPSILITTGMLQHLDRRQRRIVVAHEVAHVRHHDFFWNRVFELLLLVHLPATAHSLRRRWRQALEERADDVAANRYGRNRLAQTLITLARRGVQSTELAPSTGGGNLLRRIDRLLLEPRGFAKTNLFVEWFYGTCLLVASAAILLNHHAAETLLGFLLAF